MNNKQHRRGIGRSGRASAFIGALASLLVGTLTGCSEPAKPIRAELGPARDTPSALRGTVGSQATLRGATPVLVSGYGLVVGLRGTGGRPLPENIAASMEREMGLKGIGRATDAPGTAINNRTPRELLADPNVAVVAVLAAVPPGAPEGYQFDVIVRAINASSLEGGTLWSTDLKLGAPTTVFDPQLNRVGVARGPVFLNPFAEPSTAATFGGVTQTVGRVLLGGTVTSSSSMELQLDTPGHSRASAVAAAINSRFREGTGDRGPVARARNAQSITVTVPARMRDKPGEFVKLLEFLQIDQSFPEESARSMVEAIKDKPGMADDLAWALEAIGERAIPFVRDLYEFPEQIPQVAALRAGARLGDPRATERLRELAARSAPAVRLAAIQLLGEVARGPGIDATLRELLREKDLVTRIAAYEALARRAERAQLARLLEWDQSRPDQRANPVGFTQLEMLSRMNLPAGAMPGIERKLVSGKFLMDVVPVGEPLVYITQQGQPRIVLFGEPKAEPGASLTQQPIGGGTLNRPMLVSAWSNRFLAIAEGADQPVRIRYQDPTGARVVTGTVSHELPDVVEFLARESSPEDPRPGLGLTYSETIGILYALHQGRATTGGFATEQDRLVAELLTVGRGVPVPERPETTAEEGRDVLIFDTPAPTAPTPVTGEKPAEPAPTPEPAAKPRIVPLPPKTPK